ncbi:unnamed protein product [Bursaphelenchus xylophilus]|uniref:(pine wood nematode) hypothetical protein n=1 Tax=Bursaphelenchus xylophilus TaxID=6326 RepID=A0A1I7RRJ3_BURXY|nr:unnamed protein product [Bursaphelenchus xylophilus]CAG9131076.1 unnamed protein product [Bursaphelenchus xylophilus]
MHGCRPPNLPPIQPEEGPRLRRVESLRMSIVQLRNLRISPPPPACAPCQHLKSTATVPAKGRKVLENLCLTYPPVSSVLRVHVKIDGKEFFQSIAVPTAESCVLSGEYNDILPSSFKNLQIVIVETIDGRIQRQLGRKSLKRREIISQSHQDIWLPIGAPLQVPVPGKPNISQQPICEELGQVLLDIDFDHRTKELEFRLLDCTHWNRWTPPCCLTAASSSSSSACSYQKSHRSLHSQGSSPYSSRSDLSVPRFEATLPRALQHPQLLHHRSLPGDALSVANSPLLQPKKGSLVVSPKLGAKFQKNASFQQSQDRKRHPSIGSQPLPKPHPDLPPPFGTPGAPLYLIATVITPHGQTLMRKLQIVERRGLDPVRIDCRSVLPSTSNSFEFPAQPLPNSDKPPSLCIKVCSEPVVDDTSCYGTVQVELDPQTMFPRENNPIGPNWYSVKSRSTLTVPTISPIPDKALTTATVPSNSSSASSSASSAGSTPDSDLVQARKKSKTEANQVGEMRIRLWYSLDEVLPLCHYEQLYSALIASLNHRPHSTSLIALIQELNIDMETIARPLMKIFVHAKEIRTFFRIITVDYLSGSHDVNTLFRSQSMCSKVMYEMMKFVGQEYLLVSLKPLIDLIYAERKCCEIDPSKLKPGDTVDQNLRNIMVYSELAFSRVVDSWHRCPQMLCEVFSELRTVVGEFFPGREDIGRLALSSFLIMRFFAAAILNPKLYGLKREAPEANVSRTLVLISKVLQRLANCVVSQNPLTTKEQWLTPVLERLSDESHKKAMIQFLDSVSHYEEADQPPSSPGSEMSTTTGLSSQLTAEVPVLLKTGHMVERRAGSDKKRSFKNFIHQKRRFVSLTETELSWQKVKENGSGNELEPKGSFALSEITSVSPLTDSKHSFCVATAISEVHFQANSLSDMNEWMILIQKQQRRHMMLASRPSHQTDRMVDVDMERELELIHNTLSKNLDKLSSWQQALETQLQDRPIEIDLSPALEKIVESGRGDEEKNDFRRQLLDTINVAIDITQQIQLAHKAARNFDLKILKPPKSQPHTPNSPLASPTALLARTLDAAKVRNGSNPTTPTSPNAPQNPFSSMLVDSENYLHLRAGGGTKRVRKPAPNSLYDSKSQLSASISSLGPPPKSPTA